MWEVKAWIRIWTIGLELEQKKEQLENSRRHEHETHLIKFMTPPIPIPCPTEISPTDLTLVEKDASRLPMTLRRLQGIRVVRLRVYSHYKILELRGMSPWPWPAGFCQQDAQGGKAKSPVPLFPSFPPPEDTDAMLTILGKISRMNS
jgi:hypothetical protein